MRSWIVAAGLAFALLAVAGNASAAQCKDAKGKFIKCPPVAAATATTTTTAAAVRCKDAKGKFIKCPAPTATTTATTTTTTTAGASSPAGKPPNCVKGKACGNSCIAVDKICHK